MTRFWHWLDSVRNIVFIPKCHFFGILFGIPLALDKQFWQTGRTTLCVFKVFFIFSSIRWGTVATDIRSSYTWWVEREFNMGWTWHLQSDKDFPLHDISCKNRRKNIQRPFIPSSNSEQYLCHQNSYDTWPKCHVLWQQRLKRNFYRQVKPFIIKIWQFCLTYFKIQMSDMNWHSGIHVWCALYRGLE